MPRVLDSDRAEYEREQSLELGIEYSIPRIRRKR
jgi:hypothetical protein